MNKEFLFEMLQEVSVSGNELNLQKKVLDYAKTFSDSVQTDVVSDVIACLNVESNMKVLLTGHIDEIGLTVTNITSSGCLKVTKAGGVYVSTYIGHPVRIITRNGIIYGAVANYPELNKKAEKSVSDLTIDIGAASMEEAKELVQIGDPIAFDSDYRELLGDRICGRALDDKLGAFIVLEALKLAKEKKCKVGVYSATTVGEETTKTGAYWVSQRIKPTMHIAVDVTYASDCVGSSPDDTGDIKVGQGPVICQNILVHKRINELLQKAAEKLSIPLQVEVASGYTCTDADKVHFSNDGVATALVSIPLRYMHTPAEVGSLKDVKDCIELLAEFLCMLEEDTSLNLLESI